MTETFAPVPNWLLCRHEVSHGAKLTYGRLRQYRGNGEEAWPSFSRLAKELGVSRRQVPRYIGELKRYRLIETRHVSGRNSNTYIFPRHQWQPSGDKSVTSQQSQPKSHASPFVGASGVTSAGDKNVTAKGQTW